MSIIAVDLNAPLVDALTDLLFAESYAGGRLAYHVAPYGDGTVTQCLVCGDVEGHMDDCAVRKAEQVLNRVLRQRGEA